MRFVVCEKRYVRRMPRIVSKIEMVTSPMTSTSSVLKVRLTSTLSMTTWKNSGETSAKSWRKNEADQDLAEQMAVLVDGAEEPADVEAARKIDQPRATRHQHKTAVPDRLELRARHEHRSRRQRILNENLVFAGLAEKEIAAVAQCRDAWQRRLGQPLPVRLIGSAP